MSLASITVADDGIGLVLIDSPPVNALSVAVRLGLIEALKRLQSDAAVKAIVIQCAGRTFFAGADISEFGRPAQKPSLPDVLDAIEGSTKPVIAAIHGTALGGGYELALACHYRIATPSAKVGLPEVKLGLLPGAGGTQRLPRIVGPAAALDIIAHGDPVPASRALQLGMIDALAREHALQADALALAGSIVAKNLPLERVRDRNDKIAPATFDAGLFERFRSSNARLFRGFKAPDAIIHAVEAAVSLPFDRGIERERQLFAELRTSPESAAQRYYFFAERQTSKIEGLSASTRSLSVESVGVVGAGTMGCGIALCFLNASIPVTLVDTTQEAQDRALAIIQGIYESQVARGCLTPTQVEDRLAFLSQALDLEAVAKADLVIEAVYEDLALKQAIFGQLDGVAKPDAVLATNTSFLDIDAIASATSRPASVVGLHFFSPAHVMRLLEVVRARDTAPEVISTGMKLARTIGKIPVLSEACEGFIANRVMFKRTAQADDLALEGTSTSTIDAALRQFGFPMGHFEMMDLIGLDVVGRDTVERTVCGDLVATGRLGQKTRGGYYDYDERRRPTRSAIADELIAKFALAKGISDRRETGADELLARLLYPVVNEGAKLLEERIASRASDVDVAAILGYGWPLFTGGPMFWADTIGLPVIVAKLREFEARLGPEFRPSDLLVEKAALGASFTREP